MCHSRGSRPYESEATLCSSSPSVATPVPFVFRLSNSSLSVHLSFRPHPRPISGFPFLENGRRKMSKKPEANTCSHTLEDPNLRPSNYGDERAYYLILSAHPRTLITTGEIVRVRTHQVIHKARSAPPALLTARHLNRRPCGPAMCLTHTASGQSACLRRCCSLPSAQHFFPLLLLFLPPDPHANMILSCSSFISSTCSRRDLRRGEMISCQLPYGFLSCRFFKYM